MRIRTISFQNLLAHLVCASLGLTFIWFSSYESEGLRYFTLADDMMISMSYARTFATTGQWLWFPGADLVQGFTNPFWTLLIAGIHLFTLDGSQVSLIVSLISLAFISATAQALQSLLRSVTRDFNGKGISAILTIVLTYLNYPLLYWSLRGFEVGLLALLATVSLLLIVKIFSQHERKHGFFALLALVLSIGIWTRIDFIVIAFAFMSSLLATARVRSSREAFVLFIKLVIVSATSLLAILVFQQMYWGSWLPNTYFLKATGVDLGERIVRGLLSALKMAPIAILLVIALRRSLSVDMSVRQFVFSTSVNLAFFMVLAYSVYVGGDAWDDYLFANRYVAVILPMALMYLIYVFLSRSFVANAGERKLWYLLGISGATLGVTTNNEPSLLRSGVGILLFGLLCTWVLKKENKSTNLRAAKASSITVAFTVFTIWLSTVSISAIISALYFGGPQGSKMDGIMAEAGKELKRVTSEGALISVTWAGNPVYYSERPAIDLLGKNDSKIARMVPPPSVPGTWNEKFVPGHNKWDFEWSIEKNLPDVVFQFMDHPGERGRLADLGYLRRCLRTGEEIFILESSVKIDQNRVKVCPPSSG